MSKWIFSGFSSPADSPWSICIRSPLSFHSCYPSLIPDIITSWEWLQLSPHPSYANPCSPFCILLVILPIISVSSVSYLPALQSLAEVSSPHLPGLLQFLVLWALSTFLPLTLTYLHKHHLLCSLPFALMLILSPRWILRAYNGLLGVLFVSCNA